MIANFTVGTYPALLQDMVIKIYEVDINGASSEVGSITIPERNGAGVPTPGAGHQVPYIDSFNGLDKVVHLIKLFTASATLLDYWTAQPTSDIVTTFAPIRFRIGDGNPYTPVANTNTYSNPDMAGLAASDYIAFRTNYGPVVEGVHISNVGGGGFILIQAGDVFNGDPAEEWTIIRQPQVVSIPQNDSVVGKQWGPTAGNADMFVDVSSPVSCAVTHLRKLIRLAGSAAEYTFSAGYVPPIGYFFRVTNFGAYVPLSANPKVKFSNAPLLWGNTTKTELEIPPTGTAEFVWDGTSWNCTLNAIPSAATAVSNQIVANGREVIGDLNPNSRLITVTHGLNLLYPYRVFGIIYSRNANHDLDNNITFAVREYTANSFKVSLEDVFSVAEAIDFDWFILKI